MYLVIELIGIVKGSMYLPNLQISLFLVSFIRKSVQPLLIVGNKQIELLLVLFIIRFIRVISEKKEVRIICPGVRFLVRDQLRSRYILDNRVPS